MDVQPFINISIYTIDLSRPGLMKAWQPENQNKKQEGYNDG